jgi:hypothetical protein
MLNILLRMWLAVVIVLGICALVIGEFVHEAANWIFTVPFGGSLHNWHILPTPGWSNIDPAPEPWGTISSYAGGITASVFLTSFLVLVMRLFRQTHSRFWGCPDAFLAFGAPNELFNGITEGAFKRFYAPSDLYVFLGVLIGALGLLVYWLKTPCRKRCWRWS